jgi:hypothetical protein
MVAGDNMLKANAPGCSPFPNAPFACISHGKLGMPALPFVFVASAVFFPRRHIERASRDIVTTELTPSDENTLEWINCRTPQNTFAFNYVAVMVKLGF